MDDTKQTKITNYFPKPKPAPYTSIVENYYLTSPNFRTAIYSTKIVPHAPWGFPGEVAAHGSDGGSGKHDEILTELLKKKFDAEKVDKAVLEGLSRMEPHGPGKMGTSSERYDVYKQFVYAERLLANPGWKPTDTHESDGLNETPPIPVTLQDKHLAGTYTDADTYYLERLKSGDMMDRMVDAHGLKGLFGGIHRRKTKKSKRAQKKRKSTRKSKPTRSR
jgi:hypothetical protein